MRQEDLHDALLAHLLQRLAQLLRLHGVGELDAAQDLGREARHAAEQDVLALGQRVADAQRAVVRDADDVAGEGLVGDGAVAGEEELRRREADRLAGAHELRLHAARQPPRADAHEGDAVAMVRVHVGLDLEDEAGHAVLVRRDEARVGRLRPRRRREFGERVDEVADAEILQRRAEEHRRQVPLAEGLERERPAGVLGERDLLAPSLAFLLRQQRLDGRARRAVDRHRRLVGIEPAHEVAGEIVGAGKAAPAPDRPGHRRRVEGERLLDLVEEVERVAALAVHLVDEGDDRDVAQAADLEQLAGARLDALRGVDHHHGGIDRRQRAVGVLGEVLVARRVEEVEDAIAVLEGHDRGHDRDAALALDAHPVGAGLDAVALRLDLAGELDRAPEKQELLGQRGLAGVRMRDDGEGAPARDGVGRGGFSGCGHGLSEMGARRVDSQGDCGCRAQSRPHVLRG